VIWNENKYLSLRYANAGIWDYIRLSKIKSTQMNWINSRWTWLSFSRNTLYENRF